MDALIKKAQFSKIGKDPVVVLPVSAWEIMRARFDTLEEYRLRKNRSCAITCAISSCAIPRVVAQGSSSRN